MLRKAASFFLIVLIMTAVIESLLPSDPAHGENPNRTIQPAKDIQLPRLWGKWHEIARIPNEFQIGCRDATMEFIDNGNGTFQVANNCQLGSVTEPKLKRVIGRGWADDPDQPAKLRISFVHFIDWWKYFGTDYWVAEAGPENEEGLYGYLVLAHPRRKYGWVLSRTPTLSEETTQAAIARLESQGYASGRFRLTSRPSLEKLPAAKVENAAAANGQGLDAGSAHGASDSGANAGPIDESERD